MIKITDEIIKAYALKNAVEHNGKAVIGSVLSPLFHLGLEKTKVKEIMPKINNLIKQINSLKIEEQQKQLEKIQDLLSKRNERQGLPELPNVKKSGVIMRFRPAPSGPLHIGHIVSNLMSSLYVEKYGGKFYIIIDDTSPESTLKESYENIKKDCDWIFGNVTKDINSSDRISIYYKYIEKLIGKDYAYICTCSQEEFKELAKQKKECPCRKKSIEQNKEGWKKMLDKKGYKEGEVVLRFKTPELHGGMSNKNPAMRDFPLARINEIKHPKQGNKYRVWPLMNLVVSIDDIELKMTHIIRGKDHEDNAKRQKMIFEIFNKEFPWTFFIGRIKFTDLVLSKRKITKLIEEGIYTSHEDEKLPTIASLKKRGYTREAFVKFIEHRGLTEVDKLISEKDFFQSLNQLNEQN